MKHAHRSRALGVLMVAASGCGLFTDFDLVQGPTGATGGASQASQSSTGAGASTSGGAGGAGAAGGTGAAGGGGGLPNGESCLAPGDCASSNCVKGTCCDTACSGECESCDDASGTAGTCRPLPSGSVCDPPTCTASMQTTGRCDGVAATCEVTTMACPNGCNGSVCVGNCVNDQSCGANEYCFGATTCLPKKSEGAICGGPNECLNGLCVDGVCCNGPCGGPCEACNLGGMLGACSPVPAGTVAPVDCPAALPSTCGNNGTCNGNRGCALFPASTSCASATCAAASVTPERFCNGSGTCTVAASTSCAPYQCNGASCRTTCAVASDCVAPNVCGATSKCGLPNGSVCSTEMQCASGFCVDGVCCNNACLGECRACSAAKNNTGMDGVCGNVLNGSDPDLECLNCSTCDSGACVTDCQAGQCCCVVNAMDPGLCELSPATCPSTCNPI